MTAINPVSRKTIGMVLAGGKGERLSPLTLSRPKPGVAFGGKYKIIDFVLSNFFNSNIKNVYILTQYKSYQLNKHIRDSWDKWTGWDEHFEAISPETNSEGEEWFKGTADAISHYLRFVEDSDADYVAVFGGDHIYKMDYEVMLDYHKANNADITIAADSLWELVKLRRIAMALMERIHSNYRFVIGFNGTLIGLGLAGILPPAASAALHNLSTLGVSLRSMSALPEPKQDNDRCI